MPAVQALPGTTPQPQSAATAGEAVGGLYERHYGRILGFCLRRLNTREEAEDAVQSVFVNALRALQRGVVPISEEAWLFKIAENVCLETHRTNKRRRLREVAEPEDLPDPVVRDPEIGRELARELIAALSDLPDKQRRALLLREWRGLSYREIATDLRCTVGAVETLIFRARRNVAQALTQTKTRLAGVLNVGSLLSALKTVFSGATAAKIAAAAAVVTVATLPAGDSPQSSAKSRTSAPTAVTRSSSSERPVGGQPEAAARLTNPLSSRAGRRGRGAAHAGKAGPAAGAPSGPVSGATGGAHAAPPPAPAITPVAPAITPPNVQAPPPPVIQVPQVPQVPELPSEIQLPELPLPPGLPVQPPTKIEVPQLPKLP